MQAYAEGFDILRGASIENLPRGRALRPRTSPTSPRSGGAAASSPPGCSTSPPRRWRRTRSSTSSRATSQDTGEGRWTVEAAIEEAVPANVLSAALFARFRSRVEHTFAEKLLSAMRFGFGGHVETPVMKGTAEGQGRDPTERSKARRSAAPPCCHGDLRRRRRPDQAAARAGALQSRQAGLPAASASRSSASTTTTRHRRKLAQAACTTSSADGKSGQGEFRPRAIDEAPGSGSRSRMSYQWAISDDAVTGLAERLAKRAGGAAGRQRALLPRRRPRFFGAIVEQLAKAGLTEQAQGCRRVVIEKPFGHDLASAKALNQRILKVLREDQIYPHRPFPRQGDGAEHHGAAVRQRHLRADVEPPPHRPRADHRRRDRRRRGRAAPSTKPTGALRDMVPNHMFQLLAMIAMEPPNSFDAERCAPRRPR